MGVRLVLLGGDVVLPEGLMHEGAVVIENKKISSITHISEYTQNREDVVVSCTDMIVCPGFIDMHNQGGGPFSVLNGDPENIRGIAKVHAIHGTTGLLLTPPIELETYQSLIPALADCVGDNTGGAAILGIHAEGPFTNPNNRGFMPEDAVMDPDPMLLDEILELGGGKIVEMTIAPELPGAQEMILKLSRKGVVPSLGHSNATLSDVLTAIDHGARHVTHMFNAMSPLHHREPGLAGSALFTTELSVEVIADGFHVHPWILGLIVQNKGVMRTCLVTDAMPLRGMENGYFESLGQEVKLDGRRLSLADNPNTLAGSVLTMDWAVANMVNMVGLSIEDAVTMASTAPAEVLGLENCKGRLAAGYDADITVLDRQYDTQITVVSGRVVYAKANQTAPE